MVKKLLKANGGCSFWLQVLGIFLADFIKLTQTKVESQELRLVVQKVYCYTIVCHYSGISTSVMGLSVTLGKWGQATPNNAQGITCRITQELYLAIFREPIGCWRLKLGQPPAKQTPYPLYITIAPQLLFKKLLGFKIQCTRLNMCLTCKIAGMIP